MGHVRRRRLALVVAACALALPATRAPAALAATAADPCAALSPTALTCTAAAKLAGSVNAECRRLGVPPASCTIPIGPQVAAGVTRAYQGSWVHRTAAFQYHLGDRLPLRQAPWLGSHNSFNSVNDMRPTLSEQDSNQQLSLRQQLDIDMRSLELDVHDSGPGGTVLVCHGRGPDQRHAGCTDERPLTEVLPEIAGWLNEPARRDEVLLLYLEDELGTTAAHAAVVRQLDAALRRPDGSSLLYRPGPAAPGAACTRMPLGISRAGIRAAGARVLLVGDCAGAWRADVFGWKDAHVESGSTPRYRPFPACDAVYPRSVYDAELVRYYEDSTLVATVVDPAGSPAAQRDASLTPAKVAAMTACGVGLFGFDQILPDDGRLAATLWSWAPGQPDAAGGPCAAQGADGRWRTRACTLARRPACRAGGRWVLPRRAVPFRRARAACRARRSTLALPRTGYENALLRAAAGRSEVWLAKRPPGARSPAAGP